MTTTRNEVTDALYARAWIPTASGRRFFPLEPRAEDITLGDIAHALATQCRFTGHTPAPYSIAEHSVRVSHLVPRRDALWGLLHDASEAYLCDIAGPLKKLPEFAAYREIEEHLEHVIFAKFGLHGPRPATIKAADILLCATEVRDLMWANPRDWGYTVEPLAERIVPWTWEVAKDYFTGRFSELMNDPQVEGSLRYVS
jgi:hypothetical protein